MLSLRMVAGRRYWIAPLLPLTWVIFQIFRLLVGWRPEDFAPADAQTVLIVSVDDGQFADREELVSSGWSPQERIDKLLELRVDTIICGGIDCWSAESLQAAGVAVYDWVAGEIEDVLAALLRGDLDSDTVPEAGRCCEWRRLKGGGGTHACEPGSAPTTRFSGRHGEGYRGGRA